MNQITINLDEFKDLLQKAENVGGPGRFLSQKDYQNFLDLEKKLIAHYYFESRKKYIELFNDYIDKELSLRQFKLIFIQIWMSDKVQSKRALEKFTFQEGLDSIFIDGEAENFTRLLLRIFFFCSRLETQDLSFKLEYFTNPNKKDRDNNPIWPEQGRYNIEHQINEAINDIKRIYK